MMTISLSVDRAMRSSSPISWVFGSAERVALHFGMIFTAASFLVTEWRAILTLPEEHRQDTATDWGDV
jgi:hypothetical protein